MAAICLDVEEVVDDVSGRRAEAEAEESHQRIENRRQLQGMRQEQGDEDKYVLCPLMQAYRLKENLDRSSLVIELAGNPNLSRFEHRAEREAGVSHHGVAGKDFFENAQMVCDTLGQSGVGASSEIQLAAFAALLFQILKQFAVIGEMRRIQLDLRRDTPFKRGLAAHQP